MNHIFSKLDELEQEFEEIELQLSSPEIYQDQKKYSEVAKSHANLLELIDAYREYKRIFQEIQENKELLKDSDPSIKELAQSEIEQLQGTLDELESLLKRLMTPKDPLDEKSVIMEIRAGTGGEEAALFVADLLRMYSRYAEKNGWNVELMNVHYTGAGGIKEVICSISGQHVYKKMKYESGVHRVQRVPATESQGRIHTSAVTVAILPEAEEVDVDIDPNDLRIDVFRSSGPGGQSVNTTDSAVRVTHISTGIVVSCQDEKSQHKNKAKAMKILRSRLLRLKQDQAKQEQDQYRREQVGSGDRSERIRTYNFPQSRMTDHRINVTSYNLESILAGDVGEIIEALDQYFQSEAL
jgi:peptide chain release factor 1